MKLKKLNAALSLLSVLLALVHIGYSVFAYLTFYYNPVLKQITAFPFMIVTCLHAVLGMGIVFLQGDGTRLDLYPKRNVRTIVQRVSAALIFPLLILHLNTFHILQDGAAEGKWFLFALVLLAQVLFYAAITAHIAVSFSKALITLGLLASEKRQKLLDQIVQLLCAAIFVFALYAILKGQLAMFLPKGGAV